MNRSLMITVKHRTQAQWFIWSMLIIVFLMGIAMSMWHFPTMIKYCVDLLWICLIFLAIKSHKYFPNREVYFLCAWIGVFIAITIINYAYNFQSIWYYLWGFRNNFRYYFFFTACAFFMTDDKIEESLKIFDVMFWINAIACFIQYYIMGKSQDNLGGIFGIGAGCNGGLNLFLVIVVIKSTIFYLNNQERLTSWSFKCGISLIISSFAELKVFYIEFILVIIIAMLITKASHRKLLVLISAMLGTSVAILLIINEFSINEKFFAWESMLDYASSTDGYTASGDMNRLTGIAIANEKILKGFMERLFGLGLGNCDNAAYDFLDTPFFRRYEFLHYHWFSAPWMYLENGLVGLVMFFGFFVIIAFFVWKKLKSKSDNNSILQIVFILSVCCVFWGIYNSSLRVEAAYLVYYVLSMAFWRKGNAYIHKPRLFIRKREVNMMREII